MLELQPTLWALRLTAFAASLFFSLAYAWPVRRLWLAFVTAHLVHLGFIVWYAAGLHQPMSAFTIISGVAAYGLLVGMAAIDLARPGFALRLAWGLHFLWLNLIGMFVMQVAVHWAEGIRIHSVIGTLMMLAALAVRVKRQRGDRIDGPIHDLHVCEPVDDGLHPRL
jgi:hypothetical protein